MKKNHIQKGIRQRCILAPLLFNHYTNDIIGNMQAAHFHHPKLLASPIRIPSRTPVGL